MFRKKITSFSILFILTLVLGHGFIPHNYQYSGKSSPVLPYVLTSASDKNHERQENEEGSEHHHLNLEDLLGALLTVDLQHSDFEYFKHQNTNEPLVVELNAILPENESLTSDHQNIAFPNIFEIGKNKFIVRSTRPRGPPVFIS